MGGSRKTRRVRHCSENEKVEGERDSINCRLEILRRSLDEAQSESSKRELWKAHIKVSKGKVKKIEDVNNPPLLTPSLIAKRLRDFRVHS